MDKDTDVSCFAIQDILHPKLLLLCLFMIIRYLFIFCLFAFDLMASDHCLLYPVSLSERVQASDLIVEAKIEGDSIFESGKMIYTAYQLRIIGTLKGTQYTSINMLTEGGMLPDRALIVRPSLKPEIDMRNAHRQRIRDAGHPPIDYSDMIRAGEALDGLSQWPPGKEMSIPDAARAIKQHDIRITIEAQMLESIIQKKEIDLLAGR